MRSFASVISLKRGKSDNASTAPPRDPAAANMPRLPRTRSSIFSKAPKSPVELDSSHRLRPALTPGSSSSSEGSVSLRTPEDETMMVFPPQADVKKRWTNWFGWAKSSDKLELDPADDREIPTQNATRRVERELPRLPGGRNIVTDSDDDESATDSSESAGHTTSSRHPPILVRATGSIAQSNLKTIIRNRLLPPLSPPPLVDIPSSPQFPRSSSKHREVPFLHNMQSSMHMRRLLRLLERGALSRRDVASIAPFGARAKPSEPVRPIRKNDDDVLAYGSMRIGALSRGLRRWAMRPCFEERVVVWTPDESGNVEHKNVTGVGRQLAVYDLEISDRVEVLAGMSMTDEEFEDALRKRSSPRSSRSSLSKQVFLRNATRSRNATFKNAPSPLRIEQRRAPAPVVSTASSDSSAGHSVPKRRVASASRGVRFADGGDDSDDDIPLGYTVQKKKRQEELEKARVAERARKAKERAERREAEEAERIRMNEEARIREERQKEKYAEEIAAARQRREYKRTGPESFMDLDPREREDHRQYSRPAYDISQRGASESRSSLKGSSRSRSSSVQRSAQEHRQTSGSQSGPSAYHASVEDLRKKSRRHSTISDVSAAPSLPLSEAALSQHTLPRSFSTPNTPLAYSYAPSMYSGVPSVPPLPWGGMPFIPSMPAYSMQQYPIPAPAFSASRPSSIYQQGSTGIPSSFNPNFVLPQNPPPAFARNSYYLGNDNMSRRSSAIVTSSGAFDAQHLAHSVRTSQSQRDLRSHIPPPSPNPSRNSTAPMDNRHRTIVA